MLKHLTIDAVLKALAEPTRREIMERLSKAPASVSDLAAPYTMSLAAVVQHLQVLEECGLIKSEKIGRVRTCRIEPGGLDDLSHWIAATRTMTEKRLDRLGDLLAEPSDEEPKT
jgi:DNA-binding transcriptional ArsR family regulator